MLDTRIQVSERKVCAAVGQNRTTQRYTSSASAYCVLLRQAVINYASEYGRYGYRAITDLLRMDGWGINYKRVERIWRQEGLSASGYGTTMVPASGCVLSGKTTSGHMILCSAARPMEKTFVCL